MNLFAYILYLLITYFITVHAGQVFYRNGLIYVLDLLDGNQQLAAYINRMLLTGYYLLNLGYVALTLSEWRPGSFAAIIEEICTRTGRIMLLLAAIHFANMTVIFLISRHKHSLNHKN
ncbi:hypothetical protein HHL16_07565 [Pseudoflavitalea sp. G-6-1-2]|uniref:hypothetical protein n=1 Tax=Pseudoflavitalea sp. G-6-1-2 TaxID=2728841 RepID=UPI00146D0279|nr:hypothetical protein [Pseudoflavitalea sp. G-6-1-2]NML20726.1 hypothetical protein [Pseudoflavitalea sp. G-6-1-2]